jgi:hypothetical protein
MCICSRCSLMNCMMAGMPHRFASYMAIVPAPDIAVSNAGLLLHLDTRLLDHRAPQVDLLLHEASIFRRAVGDDFIAG